MSLWFYIEILNWASLVTMQTGVDVQNNVKCRGSDVAHISLFEVWHERTARLRRPKTEHKAAAVGR